MEANKTLFTFLDIYGEISTLTLDKFVAESLQRRFGDVHKWIQDQYNEFARINIEQSRRGIGDSIRDIARTVFLTDPNTWADL